MLGYKNYLRKVAKSLERIYSRNTLAIKQLYIGFKARQSALKPPA